MADYLALNQFAGTGAVMQVEINFAGNRPDVGSGAVPYFDAADVKAQIYTPATSLVVGSLVDTPLTQVNANTFKTTVVIPAGKFLRVYRKTQDLYPLVDFTSLQVVTEDDLDDLARQVVFLVEEAKDTGNLALAAADSATSTAIVANLTANAAAVVAADAAVKATTATGTANAALTSAGNAVTVAAAANTNAANALAAAQSADQHATNVEALAATANTNASSALTVANAANSTANGIASTANQALVNANAAVSTANSAASTANGVDAKASTALTNAAAAVVTANQASSDANTATATANGVDAKATNALATANAASLAVAGKQTQGPNLDALNGWVPALNGVAYATNLSPLTMGNFTITAMGRSLVGTSNMVTARSAIGAMGLVDLQSYGLGLGSADAAAAVTDLNSAITSGVGFRFAAAAANKPFTNAGVVQVIKGAAATLIQEAFPDDGGPCYVRASTDNGVTWPAGWKRAPQGNDAIGKQLLINGGFAVWQRASGPFTGNVYTSDRWLIASSVATKSVSLQSFPVGHTLVDGSPDYYARVAFTSGANAGSYGTFEQRLEGVSALSGQTVTLTFWAKADVAGKKLGLDIVQIFGSGGSTPAFAQVPFVTLTTSWAKYTRTINIPSASGKTVAAGAYTSTRFWFEAGTSVDVGQVSPGIGLQSGTFDIARVKLEIGPYSTGWDNRSYAEELDACLTYYELVETGGLYVATTAGSTGGSVYSYKKTKRATPAIAVQANQSLFTDANVNAVGSGGIIPNPWGFVAYRQSTAAGNFQWSVRYSCDAEL